MTPRPSARRTTRVLTPLAAAAAVLVLGGCGQLTNPIQTDVAYQSADGVAVDMGSVQIRNLVVVADSEGGPGVVVGQLLNDGADDAQVGFAVAGADGQAGTAVTVDAKAYSSISMSTEEQVTLPDVSAAPGGVVTLQVGTRGSGANVVQVPVLPAREYYEPFTPTAAPSESPSTTAPAG